MDLSSRVRNYVNKVHEIAMHEVVRKLLVYEQIEKQTK